MRSPFLAVATSLALSLVVAGCGSTRPDEADVSRKLAAATECGAEEARSDVARGHLELRGYGMGAPWIPEYAQLLNDRFGAAYKRVAGCMIAYDVRANADAYNKIMIAEIERAHGSGALDGLENEAGAAWSKKAHRPQ